MSEGIKHSAPAFFALCVAYLLSSVAAATAQTAPVWSNRVFEFSLTNSLPFIVSIGATLSIVASIRRRPVWLVLLAAHVAMFIGATTVLIDGNQLATQLSVGLVLTGQQVVAAALLVTAWRAPSNITAVLAGVFVLPEVLGSAVLTELLRMERMLGQTPLIVFSLGLLCVGVLATAVVRSAMSGEAISGQGGLDRSVVIGGTLLLTGLATLAAQFGHDDVAVISTSPALLACVVGFLIMGVTHQNRTTAPPAVRIDPALLLFCGAVAALATWVEFGPQFLFAGSTNGINNIVFGFENGRGWSRAVSLLLTITVVPIVAGLARLGRRSVSVGASAIAASGLVWVFFVLGDLQLGLTTFLLQNLLIEWGIASVLGGTIAFALRRIAGASIEAGLIAFLAALPLVEAFAPTIPQRTIGADLISNGFDDTGDVQLFTVAAAVGLIWIAAWWALRPDKAAPTEHDNKAALAVAVDEE